MVYVVLVERRMHNINNVGVLVIFFYSVINNPRALHQMTEIITMEIKTRTQNLQQNFVVWGYFLDL